MANITTRIFLCFGLLHAALAQSNTASATSSSAASTASSVVHRVDVGENGLVFEPNMTRAAIGDSIEFHFYEGMHSVARSHFDMPCQPLNGSGAIFSGRVAVDSGEGNEVFTVKIEDDNPIWFYCATQKHCQSGMVGVINPRSGGDQTIEQYASAAKDAKENVQPASTGGGKLGAASSGSQTSGSSNSGASTGAEASATGAGDNAGSGMRGNMNLVLGSFGMLAASLVAGLLI